MALFAAARRAATSTLPLLRPLAVAAARPQPRSMPFSSSAPLTKPSFDSELVRIIDNAINDAEEESDGDQDRVRARASSWISLNQMLLFDLLLYHQRIIFWHHWIPFVCFDFSRIIYYHEINLSNLSPLGTSYVVCVMFYVAIVGIGISYLTFFLKKRSNFHTVIGSIIMFTALQLLCWDWGNIWYNDVEYLLFHFFMLILTSTSLDYSRFWCYLFAVTALF